MTAVVKQLNTNTYTDIHTPTQAHKHTCNATVTCGVPQGSMLGLLLFLVYMNDIGKAIPNEKIKLFAEIGRAHV